MVEEYAKCMCISMVRAVMRRFGGGGVNDGEWMDGIAQVRGVMR
jgi:hypothetical protein